MTGIFPDFRPRAWGYPALALLCLMGWLMENGYRLNLTASMPVGMYRIAPGAPERGSLVSFCPDGALAEFARERGYLSSGSCPSGAQPFLKVAAGLPGDSITQADQGILINGVLQLNTLARPEDSHGRPMASAKLPEIIPDNRVLLLSGEHEGGFDGRYFGLVPLDALHRVERVFTF